MAFFVLCWLTDLWLFPITDLYCPFNGKTVFDIISIVDYKTTKLDRNQARKTLGEIVLKRPECIHFSRHALEEMANDELTTVDVWNVLKSTDARILDEGAIERGSYRYRLETNYIMVVIAFRSDGQSFNIVTVWDKRKKEVKP